MLLAVFLVITALFVVLGIIFASGKGANLIAGYNTASHEEKAQTNEKKLLKAMSVLMFVLAGCFLVSASSELFHIKLLIWIGQALFVVVLIAGLVYLNTGNRLKSDDCNKFRFDGMNRTDRILQTGLLPRCHPFVTSYMITCRKAFAGGKYSMKTLSKMLIAAVIAILITSALPFTAFAYQYSDKSGTYQYSLVDYSDSPDYGAARIDRYQGSASVLSIPQTLDGHKVIRFESGSFASNYSVKEVIIPEGVTYIGPSAFFHCPSLEKVTIPNSVTKIDENAFALCEQLKEVVILNHTVDIYRNAFELCHPSLTINAAPDTVYERFAKEHRLGFKSNCSDDYTPPVAGSVFGTGTTALLCGGCVIAGGIISAVITVMIKKKKSPKHLSILLTGAIIAMLIAAPVQASAYTDGGISGNYRYNVLDDGSAQIDHYDGSESVLSIPQKIDGRKVTEIDDFAFNNCDYLKEVIIPEGVTSIGRNAFYNCPSLEKVTIPDSVTKIDKMAFAWCEQLKEVTVLNHTVDICKDGFEEYTSVTIISAPDTIYEKYAKEYCLGFKSNCSDDYTPPASGSVFGTGTTALLCGGCVIAGGLVSAVITSAVMKKKKEETE